MQSAVISFHDCAFICFRVVAISQVGRYVPDHFYIIVQTA